MRALVTGGGGFLGSALVRQLRARGDDVRILARGDYPELEALGVECHTGDVADIDIAQRSIRDRDIIFHVAAKAGVWGDYEDFHETNVLGTRNVVLACKRERVRRLVFTSSPSVVFNGKDMEGADESVPYPPYYEAHYPKTKAIAERLVREANGADLMTVSLRPHLIWGPGDNHLLPRLVAKAQLRQLRRIGSGKQRVDGVYIDNAAAAHLLAADRMLEGSAVAGRVYFIAQGEPVVLWDWIDALLACFNLPPVDGHVSERWALRMARLVEWWHETLDLEREPRITPFVVKELATSHWFDLSAARRDLGYAPSISLEEGMRRLADDHEAILRKAAELRASGAL